MPTVCQVTHYTAVGNKTKSFCACRLYSGEVDRQKPIGHDMLEEVKHSRVRGRGHSTTVFCVLRAGLSEGLTLE